MDGRYFTKNEKTVRDIKLMSIARINEGIETFFGLRKVKMRSTTENTKTIRKMMLIVFIIRGIIAAISIPFNSNIVRQSIGNQVFYVKSILVNPKFQKRSALKFAGRNES